ncbi:MAG: alpha/beta hydrolase [Paracoccaceae bacterium]|nr:alpha/beta hydrolase [Paracoccaceae bacterium]
MPEPLLFLPGMMCDARLFAPQIAAFSGTRAVQVAPMTGETVEDIAASVIANAPPHFALAGLSMGGIVAMEVLRQAPDMVTRLALLDTNPMAETPEVAAAREPQIALVKAGRLEDVMRDEMKPRYLAPGPKRIEVLNVVMEMAKSLGPDLFVTQSRALMRRPDQQETLRTADCPVLVLVGSHDTVCPVSRHEFMASIIPNATLEIIEDAGHLPTLEKPEETTAALDRWLHDRLLLS